MNHVFISYARADGAQFASLLHDFLEQEGFNTWLDVCQLSAGESWEDAIAKAIEQSWALIFIMTPTSVKSEVCAKEWTYALTHQKPVLPLMLTPCDVPFGLIRLHYIDFKQFAGQFDGPMLPTIALLRHELNRARLLSNKILTLSQQRDDLLKHRDNAPNPARVDTRVNEIDEQINYTLRVITEPKIVQEERTRSIEVGIQGALQNRLKAEEHVRSMRRQRVVGSAPQGISEAFKDRVKEAADIINYLLDDNDVRAVSIVGRGGVGKTALASKILHELEDNYEQVYGIAYMSAASRTDGITLELIFRNIAKIIGGAVERELDIAWKNTTLSQEARLDILLNHLVDKRCILLFDNLEDILDQHGKLTDPDMRLFVDMFLRRQHASRLLITSREPLNPSDDVRRYEKVVPLQDGLPPKYAIELLRDFDPDGKLGLRDAEESLLIEIAEKTYGYPRALEAVAGILANDPLLSLEDLLRDGDLFGREVTEALVARAQSRLDDDARIVMQALALFGRPVTETAVRYLLEPYSAETGLDVSAIIKRLARGRYITVNRNTGYITIHPLDKEYNYRQIHAGNPLLGKKHISIEALMSLQTGITTTVNNETVVPYAPTVSIFTRYNLEKRAGDYYAQLRGNPIEWKTIDDLEPHLSEFEHRIRAGDYDTAFNLVYIIDFDHLQMWGYARKVVELRLQLVGKLSSEALEVGNYNMLGIAYGQLGEFQKAIEYHEKVLEYSRREKQRQTEGAQLGNLGALYTHLGDYHKAIAYHEEALSIAREFGNRRSESFNLNSLANNYTVLGQRQKAIQYYKESLEIKQQIGDRRGEAVLLSNIGTEYQAMGQLDQALKYFHESIDIDKLTGDRVAEGIHRGYLGDCYRRIGKVEEAFEHLELGYKISRDAGDRLWEGYNLASWAQAYIEVNQIERAIEQLREALAIGEQIASAQLMGYSAALLTEALLNQDRISEALAANQIALSKIRHSDQHYSYSIEGILRLRAGNIEQARVAFNNTLDIAAQLLADSDHIYLPKYSRGLALAGLALATQDNTYVEDSITAYRSAMENCAAVGIVAEQKRNFDALAKADTNDLLAPIRQLFPHKG